MRKMGRRDGNVEYGKMKVIKEQMAERQRKRCWRGGREKVKQSKRWES